MKYNKIGIIGAGTMGIGIAADLLFHEMDCILVDSSPEALERAKTEIIRIIRFGPLANASLPKLNVDDVVSRITFTNKIEDVSIAEFIIENVPEKWEVKESVYRALTKVCKPEVNYAVNTSCISVTKVANVTDRPDKVIGIHFMNPSYLKSCVEAIRGYHTSEECIDNAKALLAQMKKEVVLVNDLPGFVTNRISHLFMNEAAFVVQDSVATPMQVDEIFKKCYGHKMGPLETADLIGLDTVVNSLDVLYDSYQDTKFRCCPMLRKMVDANLLGRKTGKGFYNY
ncbi:3-hydroxybutyryl-CoA dehydrogenase [Anaerocolumna cellulosilytica]|uniref:3-hydroxybutyryl-CoA dehydrogenase n=1 Tax=Anaerocolumna cellulosilytica TaxID=433286 RepID=A0A6S6QZU0_9FIRM|nr:3-hydroxyacyl-CoA dehydrogenase family protein [Anaerocolumna cellulosilytica]MBB5194980.1 3-hydroxybutyryl-CoA dehydrogenase [Anaerocolumna cellulosilytica]BCJ96184.1 3-hydroxybutyryl-CoA dehydrogenase [Anaerocolumna cellulosilytica]